MVVRMPLGNSSGTIIQALSFAMAHTSEHRVSAVLGEALSKFERCAAEQFHLYTVAQPLAVVSQTFLPHVPTAILYATSFPLLHTNTYTSLLDAILSIRATHKTNSPVCDMSTTFFGVRAGMCATPPSQGSVTSAVNCEQQLYVQRAWTTIAVPGSSHCTPKGFGWIDDGEDQPNWAFATAMLEHMTSMSIVRCGFQSTNECLVPAFLLCAPLVRSREV
jgi:hypothetical protein